MQNNYAELLEKQGNYVINIGGVDWYDYNGFMMPAYLPHCCPEITKELAFEALRKSKRPFSRWSSKFGEISDGEWWCILKRGPWSIDDIKDRDKRYKIRKGKNNFIVRPLTSAEILNDCPRVTHLAAARYKTKTKLEMPDYFSRVVDASQKVPGVVEYIGCFRENVLASFAENYIQDRAVFCNIIRHDPAFLKDYSSYALIEGMLNYYLNERKLEYLSNGWRNLYHDTEFYEHLIKVFGYTKEYALLNVLYQPGFAIGVKTAYVFKDAIWRLNRKWINSMLDKVSGILRQEYICRACKDQMLVLDKPLAATNFVATSAGNTDDYPAFVTYGWCRTTYAVVLSLGRRGVTVHVSDASSSAMSRYSRYCKSYSKVPDFFIEPDRYFEVTCDALKRTGAKVLLPAHEDVGIFCRRKNELPSGVRVALPNWDSYCVAEDKLAVLDVAAQAGCPTPQTTKVESWLQLQNLSKSVNWPIVLKTRIGNSAKGVRVAHNRDELFAKFKELVETFNLPQDRWPFLQEFLPGDAAGVCMLYQNGRCVASFAERYVRCKEPGKFGTSTLREPFQNPQLVQRAVSVMNRLKWHGVAHIDFVADKNGDFRLIEINPRLWGALALSVFAGVDFPYLWYLAAMGKAVDEPLGFKYPQIKCRWIVGDCLASVELVKRGMMAETMKILAPQRRCYHDDFVLSDPLPFAFELMDYVAKFFKSGGSVNPVTGGMVR